MKLSGLKIVAAIGAGMISSSVIAYDLQNYYPLAQGNAWTYFELESESGSTALEAETYTDRLALQEAVSGTTAWRLEEYEPNQSVSDYKNIAWTDEGLMLYREAEENEGQLEIKTCTQPVTWLPRQLELGESKQSSFNCPGWMVGSITQTLQAVENVTVEAGTFTGCLKIHLNIQMQDASADETQWLCPNVGLVKANWTDSETENGQTRTESTRKELRWATVNGTNYGTGEQTIDTIRTAYASTHYFSDSAFEMHDVHVGTQSIGPKFVLDPDRLFFAYDPTWTQNGRAYPGVSFSNSYIKMNGLNLTIYNVDVAGTKYQTNWELQLSPELGFAFKGAAPMSQ